MPVAPSPSPRPEHEETPHYDRGDAAMLLTRSQNGEAFALQALRTSRLLLGSTPDAALEVLDVGCGYGFTSAALAKRCRRVVGIEPSGPLAQYAQREHAAASPRLTIHHAEFLKWETPDRFDLVVLDNVYEHIEDHAGALQRISALLKPGGVFYILVPNRLWPIEVHYGLPFLSYLPLPLANAYLRATGKGTDYRDASFAPTYWSLKRELRRHPELEFRFSLPADLSLTQSGASLAYRLGAGLIRLSPAFWAISKALLVVGRKLA